MQCGISSACFYPQDTAASLSALCGAGVHTAEIFLNTFSELEPDYVHRLKEILDASQTQLISIHPFTCSMETFLFASEYESRLDDGLKMYRRYFEVCRELGAKRFVFHGCAKQCTYPFERYCQNYLLLRKAAREYGVEFCQENVVRCKCGDPENIRRMREYTNDDVSFVLDVKQQRRAGASLDEMLDAMQGKISHVHLSDYNDAIDCMTPGKGKLDFNSFFSRLKGDGFSGDIIIELYREGFTDLQELCQAAEMIDTIYTGCRMPEGKEKEHRT